MKSVRFWFICVLVLTVLNMNAMGAYSASIVTGSLVQGDVALSMGAGTDYADETNHLDDWCLDTGDGAAITITNSNYDYIPGWGGSADSIVAFGNGGSLTLELDVAINAVAGQKEFGLFTAQAIDTFSTPGALMNGNMEASILLSSNGTDWVTLSGAAVSQDYVGSSSKLNAPTVAYQFDTLNTAWNSGLWENSVDLSSFSIADFTTEMIDDALFNGVATNADRLGLATNISSEDYAAMFGTSGGGNWFDISECGLADIHYIQLNAVNCTAGKGIRLDAVYLSDAAVPEPATMLLLGLGSLLIKRRIR